MKLEEFAERIATMRQSRGWSQTELAKRLGVSRSAVGMYEAGQREPNFEMLEAMADVFNVPLSALITTPQYDGLSPEDADALEALHQNPRLGLLFSRGRQMSDEDIDFMLAMAQRILRERDQD